MTELPFLALKPLKYTGHGRVGAKGAWRREITFGQPVPNKVPVLGKHHMIECDERYDRYHSTCGEAFPRVLCFNPGPELPESLLGPTGHVERMCAWTHISGALLFAVYAGMVRPEIKALETTTVAGMASWVSSFVLVLTYLGSTVYHIYNTVPGVAWLVRMFDHHFIILGLTTAAFADIAIATKDFIGASWQTAADPIIAGAVILLYFTYRRAVLPAGETRMGWGDCKLGLWRTCHSDLEHGGLRIGTYLIITCQFLLNIPAIFVNLESDALSPYIVSVAVGFVLMVGGMLWDHVLIFPDHFYGTRYEVACHNKRCGCVMTSHAWWHVLSLAATIVVTIGREIAIVNQKDHPTLVDAYGPL